MQRIENQISLGDRLLYILEVIAVTVIVSQMALVGFQVFKFFFIFLIEVQLVLIGLSPRFFPDFPIDGVLIRNILVHHF